ncbi:amidase family protein [Methylopila musalis]|uniref:Amidase family protein n=1 Tax=Methylopila musalis TaxID=1134781 RepID=A0ABW3Z6I2_9HYPH
MSALDGLALDFASVRRALEDGVSVERLVGESLRRVRAAAHDGVFLAIAEDDAALAAARAVDQKRANGVAQPLAGLAVSVKDNVHVAGLPTTGDCAAIDLRPQESAHAVARLEAAGAVVVAKNTLDQFATGLNGTRTREPLCRNAVDPAYIPGGSSSGSAVAVARGLVSFAIGTDTGGSGRVPAACNGVVGVKPTVGLVSGRGLLYNSRLFDTLSVFAASPADAYEILDVMAGHDPADPFSREDADAVELRPRAGAGVLATIQSDQLRFFGDPAAEAAFAADLARLKAAGFALTEIDFAPFAEAGRLVFGSAFVAERLVDYGDVLAQSPDDVHPAVRASIEPGLAYSAQDAFEAIYALAALKRRAALALHGVDALVVPSTPTIFTIEQLLAEPMTLNAIMGHYTYFANPLDLCAVAVPGTGRADGLPSSVTFLARAAQDGVIRHIADRFAAQADMRLSPRRTA